MELIDFFLRELDFKQAFIGPDLQSQNLNKQKISNLFIWKKIFAQYISFCFQIS